MNVSVFNQSHSFWVILLLLTKCNDFWLLLSTAKTKAVVPNLWAVDQYWSMGQLVPGRTEREECVTFVISDLFTIFFWTMFCTQYCNTAKWTKNKRSVKEPVDTVHLCPLLQQYPFSFGPYELHGVKCVPHIIRQVRLFFFSPNERNFIQTFPHVPNCEWK